MPNTLDKLAELSRPPAPPSGHELDALRRLIRIAQSDTGQSRRVADFLLAWWNAGQCGGFDLTNLWGVDTAIANDMTTVFGLIARCRYYPDRLDKSFDVDFRRIVGNWRPELIEE